ncbi:MAG: hypothetical protein ABI321_13790 [Polyangia bacterium]
MSEPQLALRAHSSRAQHATRTSADPHAHGHRPDGAMTKTVERFLRGEQTPTDAVKVGLHRLFVDRGTVARILVAYNSGAALGRHVAPRITDPVTMIKDPHFGWEPTGMVVTSVDAEAHALDGIRTTLLRAVKSAQGEHASMTGWGMQWSSRMVAGVSDHRNGTQLPDLDMWDPALVPLQRAWAALHSKVDLVLAREELQVAARAFTACASRFATYRADSIDGAEKSVLRLRRIQATCDAINIALGAGVGAAGLRTLAEHGIAIAVRAGAKAAMTHVARAAVGAGVTAGVSVLMHGGVEHGRNVKEGLSADLQLRELLVDTGVAVVTNVANMLVAGALAARFSAVLGRVLAERLGPQIMLELMERAGWASIADATLKLGRWETITALLGSHAASILTGSVNAAISKLRDDPAASTAQGLVDIVVTEILGNGITTALVGVI